MQSGLAPIVLFVYNRPEHTLLTLEALSRNILADKSELYIYADGEKIENDNRVKEVREIIRSKRWCEKVIYIESNQNNGLANSIIKGVTNVINKHGKVIVLEDDLITHPYFLNFCNEALEFYKDDKRVFGVSGYAFTDNYVDSYLMPIGSSWGWATWKDRWSQFNADTSSLLKELRGKEKEFDFGYYPYAKMLKDNLNGLNDSWAIRFYASMFLRKGLFLFPKHTLVQNIGFDNSGTHSGSEIIYEQQFKDGNFSVTGGYNKKAIRIVEKYFESKFKPGFIHRLFK